MDNLEWHIEAFRARATWPASSKLDALTDLEQLADPRIILFLVHVFSDQREPTEVRIHVLKQQRTGRLQAAQRQSVAEAILRVVNSDRANAELQLQAALTLAQFTDIDGVVSTLGALLRIRWSRLMFATLHSRRSRAPDPLRSPSGYFGSCRRTSCSALPPEVSCRHGTSNESQEVGPGEFTTDKSAFSIRRGDPGGYRA